MVEYLLIEVGKLKYGRIKSISILKNELNSLGLCYSPNDTKELLDMILNNSFDEVILPNIIHCLNKIFIGNKYLKNEIETTEIWVEQNFPDNFVSPIG